MKTKKKTKKFEEHRSKIKYLFRSITKNSDDYDEKYIKIIKFNSDKEWLLNKTVEIPIMATVFRPF